MVPETRVFLAADGEDLVIVACTIFDWSTHVMDGQTDRRTKLRWLRHAESSTTAFARKNWSIIDKDIDKSKVAHFFMAHSVYSYKTINTMQWNNVVKQKNANHENQRLKDQH